jgi:ABC-type oligopeptide transport system substrate-binding subunit/class 3 adenylate cyclase
MAQDKFTLERSDTRIIYIGRTKIPCEPRAAGRRGLAMAERSSFPDRHQIEQAIAALEAQRASLGDAVVDASIATLRAKLAALGETGAAPPMMEGERKLVTVMFADLSGFTAMAERMDAEAVRDLMNACFEQLVPCVQKYGGAVDKFIGDEIMALFGAPVAHENDAERALRVALEMMDALAGFNAEHGTNLGLHFGINTGHVVAGGIGTQGRQTYSVMGDAVNLASRLEDASERGEVLVGPDTHRLTAPLFEFEAREPIRVKGKTEPVAVYRLLAPKTIPGPLRGIAGVESPLVGREAELRVLAEAVERVQAGVGGIVTLVGEAGIGKSRLVTEVRRGMAITPVHWVEGRCLSYGASIAYLLWLDVLRGLLGVTPEAAPAAVGDVLCGRVQAVCPGRSEEVTPFLTRLMSLPPTADDEAALRGVEGEDLKRATFRAVETLLAGAAAQRPLVVVCEDLHWADPTSIELLEYLLPLTDHAPLLLMCAFRPETEHGCWRIKETAARLYRHRHADVWLDPLSAAESETLVDNLLRVEDLPAALRARILSAAEGNPFYVEEIVRSLMESGAIAYDTAGGRWQAVGDVAGIAIPDTLHGVLMARIDRLHEETKRVLQLASVIGRVFLYRVLKAIAEEERALDAHLLTLQRGQLIRERARLPELEYIFKHHLTQEAAYDSLLKKERRLYHRQVAEALERLFPDRLEEQLGWLAHHWERAEEPEKAVGYLLRAGDQARSAYAHAEAIGFYERALALLKQQGDLERAARTLMKLGQAYHTAFDFRQARRAYEEGFALWQQGGKLEADVPLPPAPHAFRARVTEPLTLDSTMAGDAFSGYVIAQLFSGLVELDAQMDVVPDVAQSWQVSDGGRTYTFHLREGVRWSDGRPVTAGDFEYAWKRVLDPASPSPLEASSLLYDIRGARAFQRGEVGWGEVGIRALDEVTLVVELEAPAGYFLHLLAVPTYYPVPRHVVETHGQAWTEIGNIVTNGPFKLDAWQPGRSMLFSRNPGYHGRFAGNVQRVELFFNPDWPAAPLESYAADGLDVLWLVPSEAERVRQRHPGEFMTGPTLGIHYVGFAVDRHPFDDPRVRRAFAMAIDKETLAEVVLHGAVAPATGGFVPMGMPGHSAGIDLPYDAEGARRLLTEAGYPGGRGFPVMELLAPQSDKSLCEYLQTQWRAILGVEIEWKTVEWGSLIERLYHQEPPPIYLVGWMADYPDPDNFLRVCPFQHVTRWRNETYDRLVEEAKGMLDQAGRMALYRQADRILVEAAPIISLFYGQSHMLVKPWVSGVNKTAIGLLYGKDIVIGLH